MFSSEFAENRYIPPSRRPTVKVPFFKMSRKILGISTNAAAGLAVVLLIVGAAIGYYVGLSAVPAPQPLPLMLPDVIKIGVMLPFSGPLGALGPEIARGAKLAAYLVNQTGGIGGHPVQLIIEDSPADATRAVEVSKKLVEVDGVKVIVGPCCSRELLAIGKYVNDRQVVLVSGSATSPKISTDFPDDYVFRTVGSDAGQAEAVADLLEAKGYTRAAIVVVADDYGLGIGNKLKEIAPTRVAGLIAFDSGKGDYRAELQQVQALNPDVIFYAGFVEDMNVMFKQAIQLGLERIPTIAAEGMKTTEFFNATRYGREVGDYMFKSGMIGTATRVATDTLAYQHFVDNHRKVFGVGPGLFADTYFDATMLAVLSIARAGVYEGPAIRTALIEVSQTYSGPSGPKPFDRNGDPPQDYDIWAVVQRQDTYDIATIGSWTPGGGLKLGS
jgi:branched-chain amino acid transport system substrate-binding protein